LLLNLSYCSDFAALPLDPAGDYPQTRACERSSSGQNFHSPLTPLSVTPAPRPSRSRSTVFFHAPLPLRSRSFSFRTRSTPHRGMSREWPHHGPQKTSWPQCPRKIYVKGKMDYFCIICDKRYVAYPRMSQVKDRNKKHSAGSARSIVLYPNFQNCGAAYIATVS